MGYYFSNCFVSFWLFILHFLFVRSSPRFNEYKGESYKQLLRTKNNMVELNCGFTIMSVCRILLEYIHSFWKSFILKQEIVAIIPFILIR